MNAATRTMDDDSLPLITDGDALYNFEKNGDGIVALRNATNAVLGTVQIIKGCLVITNAKGQVVELRDTTGAAIQFETCTFDKWELLTALRALGEDLEKANLGEENLNLLGMDLSGTDLTGRYLVLANLVGAILDKANLTGARLFGAYLIDTRGLATALIDNTTKFDEAKFNEASLMAILLNPNAQFIDLNNAFLIRDGKGIQLNKQVAKAYQNAATAKLNAKNNGTLRATSAAKLSLLAARLTGRDVSQQKVNGNYGWRFSLARGLEQLARMLTPRLRPEHNYAFAERLSPS